MDAIRPSGGLPLTAARLTQDQSRFDAAAEALVAASSPDETVTGGDLGVAVGDMTQERLLNGVLMGVFRARDRQDETVTRVIDP